MKATAWNQKTIDEFHAKQGRGVGMWGDHVLLMTAKGAKSGDAITTPLVYGRDGENYVIVASKGGAPDNPKWFGNLKANPEVEIVVANADGVESFKARAKMVESRHSPADKGLVRPSGLLKDPVAPDPPPTNTKLVVNHHPLEGRAAVWTRKRPGHFVDALSPFHMLDAE
jgi:deazaflavin-dependent oxidoreductase (nitroreductase family)